jgi:murein DD-endopeptidase MepM/ murein hydrolase activator NlpD
MGGGKMRGPLLALLVLVPALAGCAISRPPIESEVTSPFGLRRMGFFPTVHRGVDLRAQHGTPVQAMANGRVRYAGWMDGFGNVVWLDHRGDVISVYAHLSEILVTPGATISGGQLIGMSGATGNVTGPHLHFEVWVKGRPVDPIAFLGGRP